MVISAFGEIFKFEKIIEFRDINDSKCITGKYKTIKNVFRLDSNFIDVNLNPVRFPLGYEPLKH